MNPYKVKPIKNESKIKSGAYIRIYLSVINGRAYVEVRNFHGKPYKVVLKTLGSAWVIKEPRAYDPDHYSFITDMMGHGPETRLYPFSSRMFTFLLGIRDNIGEVHRFMEETGSPIHSPTDVCPINNFKLFLRSGDRHAKENNSIKNWC